MQTPPSDKYAEAPSSGSGAPPPRGWIEGPNAKTATLVWALNKSRKGFKVGVLVSSLGKREKVQKELNELREALYPDMETPEVEVGLPLDCDKYDAFASHIENMAFEGFEGPILHFQGEVITGYLPSGWKTTLTLGGLRFIENASPTSEFQVVLDQMKGATREGWHRHPNGGGWVEDTASVAETVYVGLNAQVCGKAEVGGLARVSGTAQVSDNATVGGLARVSGTAQVYGNAEIYDDALVTDHAKVYGHAWVSGNATVSGDAEIYDNAWVKGYAKVTDHAQVYGNAVVKGYAHIFGDETPVPSNTDSSAKIPKKESSVWVEGVKAGVKNAVLEKIHPALLMATENGRDELISREVEGILEEG